MNYRNKRLTLFTLKWCLGIMASFWLFLPEPTPGNFWRGLVVIGVLVIVEGGLYLYFLDNLIEEMKD